MAKRIALPPLVDALDLLDRVDYADAHVAQTNQVLTPEAWCRLVFEVAPEPMLRFGRLVHRYALGLEITASSPERPMGWTQLDAGADAWVLCADGPRTRVRLIGFTRANAVGLVTQMTLENRLARLTWALIAPIHRAFARDFLDRAVAAAWAGTAQAQAARQPAG